MTSSEIPHPPDAHVHVPLRLVTWRPRGTLDAALTREILAFLGLVEALPVPSFQRFTDFSALDAVQLNFTEVEELAQSRIESYQGAPVKSAILAPNPLAYGMARMYEQLMRRSPIEVRVFSQLTSAAMWLEMPVEVLAADH